MVQDKGNKASNVYNQVPFSELLGSPLMACIDAQKSAAESSIDFIKSVGMVEGTSEIVSVSFYFKNGDDVTTFVVPLLSIVPIPFFSVDVLDIEFNAMVDLRENIENIEQFIGRYSKPIIESSKYNYDYYSNLNVHMHASRDHMPTGLSFLLNVLDKSILLEDKVSKAEGSIALKLNYNELKLNVGDSDCLSVDTDDKIIWGCNKPECVQVTQEGVVKGLKEGNAKVYARNEDGTLIGICRVFVISDIDGYTIIKNKAISSIVESLKMPIRKVVLALQSGVGNTL